MVTSAYFPIFSDIVKHRALSRPVQPYVFKEGELFSPLVDLNVRAWGAYLRLHPSTVAVLFTPDGNRILYEKGDMLYLEQGNYGVRYVDMRRTTTPLLNIQADSSDTWQMTMNIDLTWEISKPLDVVQIAAPFRSLQTLCRSGVVDFIQAHKLEVLVPTHEGRAMADAEIARNILGLLQKNPALDAFRFISINVRERKGDRRKIDVIQNAQVDWEKREQEFQNKIKELRREVDKAQQEVLAVKEEYEVKLATARGDQKVTEVGMQTQLSQAQLQAQIAATLRKAQEQEVEIKNLRDAPQLMQARVIRAMELYGAAFSDFARVLAQAQLTPGFQKSLEETHAFEHIEQAFRAFYELSPGNVSQVSPIPEPKKLLSAVDIRRLD